MFCFPVRVYYSDTDAEGIVYHTHYLDFAEHARTEMFRSLSIKTQGGEVSQRTLLEKSGLAFVISSVSADFKKPGLLDDLLEVRTSISSIKRFSMVFDQKVMRGDELLVELKVKVAAIDLSVRRPTPVPQWLVDAILSEGHLSS